MISLFIAGVAAAFVQDSSPEPIAPFEVQGFRTHIEVVIEAPRDTVFDAATGDITGWWDHSFALDPHVLHIEPVADGRFYEQMRAGSDDGALHARVIYVDAPEQLRLHGPLGLSGQAIDLVSSWTLSETDQGHTRFRVDLAMMGEIDSELAGIVRDVWVHFIDARLKPYVEAQCHLTPDELCAAFETDSD